MVVKKKMLTYATIRLNPETTKSQNKDPAATPFISIITHILVVPRARRPGVESNSMVEVSSGDDKKCFGIRVIMIAQDCKYIKSWKAR